MKEFVIKKSSRWLLSILIVFVLAGCGYSSHSILKKNVGNIYIPIFDNKTFRRGLEFGLSKAIKDEIMFKTQLKIVDKENADSILLGTIVDFKENVMIVDSNDNIVESQIFVVVDFTWKDLRTGRAIVAEKGVIAPTEFVARRGETIETAQNESFVDVAEKIVDLMGEGW